MERIESSMTGGVCTRVALGPRKMLSELFINYKNSAIESLVRSRRAVLERLRFAVARTAS